MKKLLLSLVIFALLTIGFVQLVSAGDSATIRISCTIPTIPGVNVPIQKENQLATTTIPITIKPQESNNLPVAFQKDTLENRMVNGQTTQFEVRTIYSR
jgi:hypothetical protein